MDMLEHDYEPTPGMPQALPEDERVLWQAPAQFRRIALSTFHVRKLAIYFAALIGVSVAYDAATGVSVPEMTASAATFAVLAAIAVGLLTVYARLVARATMYTVTNRRVVMRTGVAVPVTVNLPFSRIDRAALRTHADGTGEIAIVPDGSGRASVRIALATREAFPLAARAARDAWRRRRGQRGEHPGRAADPTGRRGAGTGRRRARAKARTRRKIGGPPLPALSDDSDGGGGISLVVFALVAVTWGQLFRSGCCARH